MSSFISPFKPWLLAILVLLGIEATVYAVGRPNEFDRTNFLEFSFLNPASAQRLFIYHKVREFADTKPMIVQSGDSSGFYGIDPRVVTSHLPEGTTYLNMSCCANLGFRGYYNALKFFAERNDSVRYMVLHFTPYTMPIPEMWDNDGAALWGDPNITVFGDAFWEAFMSPWRAFYLPSMAWRREVTNLLYYAGRISVDRPILDNVNYLEVLRLFKETWGWMPESDVRTPVPPAECDVPAPEFFDFRTFSMKSYLEEVLDEHAALARSHNATLVVVFQPVACILGTGAGSAEARAIVEDFKRNNPDVEIPFPLIETWAPELFSVPAHVVREKTDLIGNRLGEALAEIMARHEAAPQS
jgi:hypothetical protein